MTSPYMPAGIEFVCNRCRMPVTMINGKWQHVEPADSVFCQLVMRGGLADADQE